jgi:hypothetical protein
MKSNPTIDGRRFQLLGRRPAGNQRRGSWRQRRRQGGNPLLVLNMALFNLTDGWSRTLSKVHENVT